MCPVEHSKGILVRVQYEYTVPMHAALCTRVRKRFTITLSAGIGPPLAARARPLAVTSTSSISSVAAARHIHSVDLLILIESVSVVTVVGLGPYAIPHTCAILV